MRQGKLAVIETRDRRRRWYPQRAVRLVSSIGEARQALGKDRRDGRVSFMAIVGAPGIGGERPVDLWIEGDDDDAIRQRLHANGVAVMAADVPETSETPFGDGEAFTAAHVLRALRGGEMTIAELDAHLDIPGDHASAVAMVNEIVVRLHSWELLERRGETGMALAEFVPPTALQRVRLTAQSRVLFALVELAK